MEFHQDPSSFSSLQLLEELEYFIVIESGKNGTPWIRVDKLTELFDKKYGVSLELLSKVQGYSDGLRSLLTSSGRFSIYGTPILQEFYVALLQAVVPSFHQSQATSIKYRIKRGWKVDGSLLRMFKAEGAEDISHSQVQRISEYQPILVPDIQSVNNLEIARISECQPILVPDIQSVNDLEIALRAIIKSLTANHPKTIVTIAVLSKKFHENYKKPIRTVMRSVCPDMKLIELLQTIPSLHVQKVDNDWQITVENHSVIE